MRVLMLSWEYPPRIVGGLARHVEGLSESLVKKGVNINVITPGDEQYNSNENSKGVQVHRVPQYSLPTLNFISDIQHINFSMLEEAVRLINSQGNVDLIHAHDWLVAYAAKALKHIYQLPLISTIHATEHGRHNGIHNDIQHYISSVEWLLTYESWKVIVCSSNMKDEVKHIFQLPEDKIEIIRNGIHLEDLEFSPSREIKREHYALPNEKIVFFIGRLVPEKGVQTLLNAAPKILSKHPLTKFIIAGKGPYENELKHTASSLGIQEKVSFLGYIDDNERNALYKYADVVVFPSLYEPFGIVALEGMASGTPTIVSDTGGFKEIVDHHVNGLKFFPDNPDSLADQVEYVLSNPDFAEKLTARAKKEIVEKYSWDGVAQQTLDVYKKVLEESREKGDWLPNWPAKKAKLAISIGRYEL